MQPPSKIKKRNIAVGGCNVKSHEANALKSESEHDHHKSSPPNSSRKSLNTASNETVSRHQRKKSKYHLKTDTDHTRCSKKHGDDRLPPRYSETQGNDGKEMPSNKNKGDERIQHSNKTKRKGRLFNKPCAEACDFANTDDITMFNKPSYKVAIIDGLNASRTYSVNPVFETCAGPSLVDASTVEQNLMSSVYVCEKPQLQNVTSKKVDVT